MDDEAPSHPSKTKGLKNLFKLRDNKESHAKRADAGRKPQSRFYVRGDPADGDVRDEPVKETSEGESLRLFETATAISDPG